MGLGIKNDIKNDMSFLKKGGLYGNQTANSFNRVSNVMYS